MFQVGDRVRFVTEPQGVSVLKVEAVSQHEPMIRVDGSWNWADRFILVESAPPPDSLDEQLKFLGM